MAEKRRGGDINIDVKAIELLQAVFVTPSRFAEVLRERGISIAEGQATGVATRRTLEQEAVRLQVPPANIRDVVRSATGRIVKMGGYPELFPPMSDMKIVRDKTIARQGSDGRAGDVREFYRLSTLSVDSAESRLAIYEGLLPSDIEEYRRGLISARKSTHITRNETPGAAVIKREEIAPVEEVEVPSVGTIRIVAPFVADHFSERVNDLTSAVDERNVVEPISVEMHPQAVTGIFSKVDIDRITAQGIAASEFPAFIASSRSKLIQHLNRAEDHVSDLADEVLSGAEGRLIRPGRYVDMPVFVIRDLAELVAEDIKGKNSNENIDTVVEMDLAYNHEGEPIPRKMVKSWVRRFKPVQLEEMLPEVVGVDPKLGETLEYLLLDDNRDELLGKIKRGEEVFIEGQRIDKNTVDQVLGKILLSDEVILQALFADVLAMNYKMPYLLEGVVQEVALVRLGYLAEQFSSDEIKNALTTSVEEDLSGRIAKVRAELRSIEDTVAFLGIRAHDNLNLDLQKRIVEEQLARLTQQMSRRKTVIQNIDSLVRSRVPKENPKIREYPEETTATTILHEGRLYDAWMAISPEGYPNIDTVQRGRLQSRANIRSIMFSE